MQNGEPDLQVEAVYRWLSELRSAPLLLGEWANVFGVSRNRIRGYLAEVRGVTSEAGRWRLRLVDCPPAYFQYDPAALSLVQRIALSGQVPVGVA